MQSTFVKFALLCAATLAIASPSFGQRVKLTGGALAADHEMLNNALTGGGIELAFARPNSRYALRFSGERHAGNGQRFGSTCTGFVIAILDCAPEALHDQNTIITASLGVSVAVLRVQRFSASLLGDGTIAALDQNTRGLRTGRPLSASQSLWGGSGGVGLAWRPSVRAPIMLEAQATAGKLRPRHQGLANPDGYEPFIYDGFTVRKFGIGISYLFQGKPRQ